MSAYTYRLCPHCGYSRLERIHRGFIKKYILRISPMFICGHCEKSVLQSEIRHEPMFNAALRQSNKTTSYKTNLQ